MKDAGGQKVSAQPFPRAIGSHSLSPSLLVVDTTPIVSFANTTKKYPYLFEIINSINDTTESRVILQFCLTTATTNNIQSHICAFVRYLTMRATVGSDRPKQMPWLVDHTTTL